MDVASDPVAECLDQARHAARDRQLRLSFDRHEIDQHDPIAHEILVEPEDLAGMRRVPGIREALIAEPVDDPGGAFFHQRGRQVSERQRP